MTEKEKLAIKGLKEITPILKSLSDEEVFKDFKTEIEIFIICYKNFEEKIADLKEEVNKIAFENGELKKQIEKMKQERSAEIKQRAINEIVSAIEKDREEGR